MEGGQTRILIYVIQFGCITHTGLGKYRRTTYLHSIFASMAGNIMGHHPSIYWMETHTHRNSSAHRQYIMDDIIHPMLENMNKNQ